MTERVLVANRGEIAVRVVRACRDLGWEPIAVYADGDEDAVHVRLATESYRLRSERPIPYLDGTAVIEVARRAGARFIHPGYGFLAENATFARGCADAGLTFVGPSPDAIATMGDKLAARAAAERAGVPILPGTREPVEDTAAVQVWAETSEYPIALKAAAGGGGRGFRIAHAPDELESAFRSAQSEAERAFGDGRLYAERYLVRPRHVEVQVFADRHGRVVAIGDRDCSIQRRHQKLVEECPAPGLSDETRRRMAEVSVSLTAAVGYEGAGTLEFLVEEDERFWFLEMNTRIQVEHTVTEEIFGIDLVREQLLVASGKRLSFPDELTPRGHSIQCRVNAEDPGRQFAPTPGLVARFAPPLGPGVRVDTAIESGAVISDRYDSMIAKIVATGRTRDEAICRMSRALAETAIDGPPTTLALHQSIMSSAAFQRAELSTSFLIDHQELIPAPAADLPEHDTGAREWQEQTVEVNGRCFSVRVPAAASRKGAPAPRRTPRKPSSPGSSANGTPTFTSPLQGSVLRISRNIGDVVSVGDPVRVLEAMKMENEIAAHRSGRLSEIVPAVGG